MPKQARQNPGNAVPVRVEVVPRRGLSRQEAARYVGISTTKFDELVGEGQMPRPFRIGSRTIWDLRKLDAAFDLLSGPDEKPDSFADWDPPAYQSSRRLRTGAHSGVIEARKRARHSLSSSTPSKEHPGHPNIYTTATLAEYWNCSAGHIHNLIRRGELAALRPSPRSVRITPAAVIAFEEANVVMPDH